MLLTEKFSFFVIKNLGTPSFELQIDTKNYLLLGAQHSFGIIQVETSEKNEKGKFNHFNFYLFKNVVYLH